MDFPSAVKLHGALRPGGEVTVQVKGFPPPAPAAQPLLVMNPVLAAKIVAGFALATAGMYYLGAGKRDRDLNKMLIGAALVLAGTFVFL